MGRIQQLDTLTANMIAAGEVVERPMGVVKELVENAIDAGSTRISVTLEEGGLKKITVQDNGIGMDSKDAEMSFHRHATSKIHKENDLWNIHTLGFRGEALPSIAAVSKTTLITCDGTDNTKIVIAYGKVQSVGAYPCSQGTEITVEDLFYQTPARLKHMRSASYESSLIQDVISKFALSHPEIAFQLINEGRNTFRTSGQDNLQEVIYSVYGRGAAENSISVNFQDFDYEVKGYVIAPVISRASRTGMNIFLNGRMVRTYKLYKAVQDAYEGMIPQGRYPICILSIEMDPHLLDVNVHPSKWEVRLSKENQLENLLLTEIKKAIHTEESIHPVEVHKEEPVYYEPLSFDKETLRPEPVKKEDVQEEILKEAAQDNYILKNLTPQKEEVIEEKIPFPMMEVIGQYHDKYVVCASENGLIMIDMNAAGQRILYEEVLKEMNEAAVMIELLLPITVHTSNDIVERKEELNESLKDLHITFESFGRDTLIVHSIPSWMQDLEEEQFLKDLIDYFKEEKKSYGKEKTAEAAVMHHASWNKKMSIEEMNHLVIKLSECDDPFYTPKGKPVFIKIENNQIEREFRR